MSRSSRGGRVNTVTLFNREGYASLCAASDELAATASLGPQDSAYEKATRRRAALKAERDAKERIERRRMQFIELKHREYVRLQHLPARARNLAYDEVAFREKVEHVLAPNPIKTRAAEVLAVREAQEQKQKQKRYVEWQETYYAPQMESIRAAVERKSAKQHSQARHRNMLRYLSATNRGDVHLDDTTGALDASYEPIRVPIARIDPLKKPLTKRVVEKRLLKFGPLARTADRHVRLRKARARPSLAATQWRDEELRATPHGRSSFLETRKHFGDRKTRSDVYVDDFTLAKPGVGFDPALTAGEFPRGKYVAPAQRRRAVGGVRIAHQSANIVGEDDW